MQKIQNYVGGQLVDPISGNWLDNHEPAAGRVYSQVPDSNSDDVETAVNAAKEAFVDWRGRSNSDRAEVLNRLADIVDQRLDDFAAAESRDNGKTVKLARMVDIPRVGTNLRFFASLVQGSASESHRMPEGLNYTLRDPIGPVACISPWNLPLYLLSWKVAPALAVGNCVIAKPSEVTPMTAFMFSQACIDAGLPPGVLNIVHGSGHVTGNAIVDNQEIKAISFTGGTKTGGHIAAKVAPTFRKFALELGGKNPNLIFADCDYDSMMETTLRSSFANQGQICLCGSRVLVQKSIYEKFRDDFVTRAQKLRVGDPSDDLSDLGAVVSQPHQQKILSCIDRARDEGGTILCGGEQATVDGRCADGWFVKPTVIEGLPMNCQTNQEEIFGPVVTLTPFDDDDDALAMANQSKYGLTASVWTGDISRGHRMASQIEAGVVWVNCWMIRDLRTPFGGMKQSGVGREGGLEALRFWTEPKNVCVKY